MNGEKKKQVTGIPRVYFAGSDKNHNYMVMELLGNSFKFLNFRREFRGEILDLKQEIQFKNNFAFCYLSPSEIEILTSDVYHSS